MVEQAEKRTNLFHWNPRNLRIKAGLNVRDLTTETYQAKIRELAEDIAVNGATARHVAGPAEPEATVKQMRKLVSILRVQASKGGAGAGSWASRWLIEAGINTDDEE